MKSKSCCLNHCVGHSRGNIRELDRNGKIWKYMYLMYLYVNVCKCILHKTGVAALITALVTLVETPVTLRNVAVTAFCYGCPPGTYK